MPAENPGIIGQGHKLGVDVAHRLLVVTAGEIGAADAQIEKGIATKQHAMPVEAHALRTVAGGVNNLETQFANLNHIPFTKQSFRIRRRAEGPTQHRTHHFDRLCSLFAPSGFMDSKFSSGGLLNLGYCTNMVSMQVSSHDKLDGQPQLLGGLT